MWLGIIGGDLGGGIRRREVGERGVLTWETDSMPILTLLPPLGATLLLRMEGNHHRYSGTPTPTPRGPGRTGRLIFSPA